MESETDRVTASGELLMRTGAALSPTFSGTGFNDKVRVFPDFASRIYFFESTDEQGQA